MKIYFTALTNWQTGKDSPEMIRKTGAQRGKQKTRAHSHPENIWGQLTLGFTFHGLAESEEMRKIFQSGKPKRRF